MKWVAPALVYFAVAVGMFQLHSAWGALLAFHLAMTVSLLIARPNIPIKTLLTGSNFKWSLVSILLCGGSGLVLYLLWDRFGIVEDISARVAEMGLKQSSWVPFIAYFTLINPLLEEYFWRGYLGSNTPNLHISDFLYAGFHGLVLLSMVQPLTVACCMAILVLAGWFWRQIFHRDQGLLTPVFGHMAADLTILLAVYWKV